MVHFACLWNCNGFTVVKSNYGRGERKQRFCGSLDGRHFRALAYAFVFNGYGIRAISPLNTPPTDAVSEIWLHDSAKVQGSLNMKEKLTVNGAEELAAGARKKIPTDKGEQYEIQRLKIVELWLFAT